MSEQYDFPQRGIDKYVTDYLRALPDLRGKAAVDIPCGDGRASYEFHCKGASVKALDLYPEFIQVREVESQFADMSEKLPLVDAEADYVICQEGIEHVENQLSVLCEFNRILRIGGELIITTPSLSHMRARLSMLLFETDLWKRMPPTELDSVWISEKQSDRLYLGHLFLTGVQHMWTLARLSGFEVVKRHRTDISNTSVVLSILAYPFLVLTTLASYALYQRKITHVEEARRKRILWERVKLNLSPRTLIYKDIFWTLKKRQNFSDVIEELKEMTRGDQDRCQG